MSEPVMKLEYEHGMDADASRKHLAEKAASQEYSLAGNKVNLGWDGDKATVSVAGAKGYIEFLDKKAVLTVTDLPLLFRPMKAMIEGQIRALMKKIYTS